jgi:hypothetical protein
MPTTARGTLNSDLVLSGSGRLRTRAPGNTGIQGTGGIVVGSGTSWYIERSHISCDYTFTGGVTIKNGGVVDVSGRSAGQTALGDGLLTIEEGGLLQAINSFFDQDVLFDINSTGTTDAFITGGGSSWNASGEWTFDLTDAGNTLGDSWNIIGIGGSAGYNQTEFSVAGFSEDSPGVWNGSANDAVYTFDESTGVLSVTAVVPEPGLPGPAGCRRSADRPPPQVIATSEPASATPDETDSSTAARSRNGTRSRFSIAFPCHAYPSRSWVGVNHCP